MVKKATSDFLNAGGGTGGGFVFIEAVGICQLESIRSPRRQHKHYKGNVL